MELDRAKFARHYVSNLGFGLVSMPLGSKGPRHKGWNEPENAITNRLIAHREWSGEPKNMGLLHSVSGTATLDIDHREWTELALAALGLKLDDLQSAVAIRGKNGVKPLFLIPDGIELSRVSLAWPHPTEKQKDKHGQETDRPVSVTLFELRAGDVQDVLPPSIHPDTGLPYEWVGEPRTRQDITTLPPALLDLWQNWTERVQVLKDACPWKATEPPSKPRQAPSRPSAYAEGEKRPSDHARERIGIREVLERNGYQPRGDRYLPPSSKTKVAGVRILTSEDGFDRAFSDHGSCPLNDGHAHDSFSAIKILEHGGDASAAARAVAQELGLEPPVRAVEPSARPAPAVDTLESVLEAWRACEGELLMHGFEMLDAMRGNERQKHAIRDLWAALLDIVTGGQVYERGGRFFANPGGITKLRGMGITGHHADISQRLKYMASLGFHSGVVRSVPSDPASQLLIEIPADPRRLPVMKLERGRAGKSDLSVPTRRKTETLHKVTPTKDALPKGRRDLSTRFESALPTIVALLAVPDATTADLAEFRGVGVETVRRHVRMLREAGMVTVTKRVIRLTQDWPAVKKTLRIEREHDAEFRKRIIKQLERTIHYCKATLYTRRAELDEQQRKRRKHQLQLAEQRLERIQLGEPVYAVLGLAA